MARQGSLWTVLVYLALLLFVATAALFSARYIVSRPWTARERVQAICVLDRIYAIGGVTEARGVVDEVLEIDPGKRRMRMVGRIPPPRLGASAAEWKNRIYLLGGLAGDRYLDQIVAFDPISSESRVVGHLPSPRAYGGATCWKGKLYYVGGWDGEHQLDEIVAFDTETGSVRLVGRLPSPREFVAVAALEDRLYVIGGEGKDGRLAEILEFDLQRGELLRRGKLPIPMSRCAATVLGDEIYVAGGWAGKPLDELLMIDTSSDQLEIVTLGQLPHPMADPALVALGEKLYVIGDEDPELKRQIGVFELDPLTGLSENLRMRSFLRWWGLAFRPARTRSRIRLSLVKGLSLLGSSGVTSTV